MKQLKMSTTQIIRHVIQLVAFLLLPGMFLLITYAIRGLYQAIIFGTFTMAGQWGNILLLLTIIPATILWGRVFCGYLCAFGSMQELFNWLARKLKIKQLKISDKADRILKYGKYVVIILLVLFWTLKVDIQSFSPWYVFGIYSSYKGWTSVNALLTVGGLFLILIIIGGLFVQRFFCRYLCPLGGLFTLISPKRLMRIKKQSGCVNCGKCNKQCPMRIAVSQSEQVKSGECIDCYQCTDVCPVKVLHTKPKPILAGSLAAVVMIALFYVVQLPVVSTWPAASKNPTTAGQYTDGTYTGIGTGYRGEVKVTVKVSGGSIVEIIVDSYADDSQFFNRAQSAVISQIIANQTPDVDVVSGATYSSRGLMEAVATALGISDILPETNPAPGTGGGHGGHGGHGRH